MRRRGTAGLVVLALCSLVVACSGGGTGDARVAGSSGGIAGSPSESLAGATCARVSLNGPQLIATVIRAGAAYDGELLAAVGEFESASSPVRAAITRRDDAVAMLRGFAGESAALAASGGIQSNSGEPVRVNGRTVVEVRSTYGTAGRVVTVVDCATGLVRRVVWESFG